jgi:CheW-like protein
LVRGGVLVKRGGEACFLPASVVVGITPCPPISRVPGAPKSLLGIVHTGGEIVPVVAVDDRHDTPLIVCRWLGEPVGILGCEVLKAGMIDEDAPSLDVASMLAGLRSARWTALEGGTDG